MRKNKRKIQALDLLDLEKPYLAARVASELGISKNSAHNLLRRLWKQGLARRKKKDNGINYWITRKGMDRLHYLRRERIRSIRENILNSNI